MLESELLASYKPEATDRFMDSLTWFPANGKQEMVIETGVPIYSLCAHHMLPFFGVAHVGYIPEERIFGLSKIPRVIDFFSRKLQMQERLTSEVADFLHDYLGAKAVIVVMECRHFCMESRGVQKAGVTTKTSALRGIAETQPHVKEEFLRLIK